MTRLRGRSLDAALALDLFTLFCVVVVGAYLLLAVALALLLPIHSHDALGFGQLSRLIALHGGFHFAAVPDVVYHRPLFYVLQGELWRLFGFHEPLGRLLSLAFCVLFLLTLVLLARDLPHRRLVAALALVLVLCMRAFAQDAFSGLTDVPVAAMVGVCGVLVWRDRGEVWRPAAIVLAAAATGLAKPTALTALVGLGLAQLIGASGALRERILRTILPLALGAELALFYGAKEASRFHERLGKFLTAGSTPKVYRQATRNYRIPIAENVGWMGPGLRPLAIFALVWAVLFVAGVRHRVAALVAGPAAIVLAVVGPVLATHGNVFDVGPFQQNSLTVSWLLCAGVFALAPLCRADDLPSRQTVARLLVWTAVPLLAWLVVAPIAPRLLSPAWPPFLLLVGVALAPAVLAATRLRPWLVLLPAAAIAVVIAANTLNVEELGPQGWKDVGHFVRSGHLTDRDAARAAVLPAFESALERTRPLMGARGTMLTNEGDFKFFFPGRVGIGRPDRCGVLAPYDLFVWGLRPLFVTRAAFDPRAVLRCVSPRTRAIQLSEDYTIIGISRRRAPGGG